MGNGGLSPVRFGYENKVKKIQNEPTLYIKIKCCDQCNGFIAFKK